MSSSSKSKEGIKNKLFKHAARMWGVKNVSDLDPLIQRLSEGLASELYEVYNTIEDIQTRILENLASVLTPKDIISPRPGHAILHAFPEEPMLTVKDDTVFYDDRLPPEMRENGIAKLFFTPAVDSVLVKGNVRYVLSQRSLYEMEGPTDKRILANSSGLTEEMNHTVWIGIELDPNVKKLSNIPFYMAFPQTENRYEAYSLLKYTKWYIDGESIPIKNGYPYSREESNIPSIFSDADPMNVFRKNILDFYRNQYVTLNTSKRANELQKVSFPENMDRFYKPELIDKLKPCIWIRIEFPPHITDTVINDTLVLLNTFPVINRRLINKTHKSNNIMGIVSLTTGVKESFLSVEKVVDSYGAEYTSIPYQTSSEEESGVYTLKCGGMERFDVRSANDYLERLNDLIRSEISAFSMYGIDTIKTLVTELQSSLRKIEQKLREKKTDKELNHYLLVDTIHPNDILFVDYWVTANEYANGLTTDRVLKSLNTLPVDVDSVILVSNTIGGKKAPSPTGLLNAFRYALTGRDVVCTQEDIKNYCWYELSGKITDVEVCRGIAVSPRPKEGLIRVTEIVLTAHKLYREALSDPQVLAEFQSRLESKSLSDFRYRIKVV
jgi:hypothetical protein